MSFRGKRWLRAIVLAGGLAGVLATGAARAQHEPPASAALDQKNAGAEPGVNAHHDPAAEHHDVDYKSYGFQILNFAILAFILAKFGGGALNKMFAARREQLRTDLAEASAARTAAEARLAQQEKRLANLEAEIAAMRAAMKQEAEDEKNRLVAAADERVRRVQAETQFLLEQQIKDAEIRFRDEIAAAALQVAEAEVRKALQPSDEARLVHGFVTELERSTSTSARTA